MALVNGVLGIVGVLIAMAGAVTCAMHLGRSRFVPVLLAGFAVEAVVGLAYPLAPMVLRAAVTTENILAVYAVLRIVGLAAQAAIVGGMVGLLGERRSAAGESAAA
jgi:hypothetical protein